MWVSTHFTVPYAKSNSVLAKASKCCSSCSASITTFFPLSSRIGFCKGSGLKLTFLKNVHKSPVKIYQGGFCFVFGVLFFSLLVTLTLETSGFGITLFLSQKEDSVNTKCKVEELREVLQQVVWLNWNKCWFVQKKKIMPFLDLVSLDFLFPFFAKARCVPLAFRNPLTQLWGITSRLFLHAFPADVVRLPWLCTGCKPQARAWVHEIECVDTLCLSSNSAAWSSCSLSFSTSFHSVKTYSGKELLCLGR